MLAGKAVMAMQEKSPQPLGPADSAGAEDRLPKASATTVHRPRFLMLVSLGRMALILGRDVAGIGQQGLRSVARASPQCITNGYR
jgi:hypothetical protein